jgi:hypothetical protein
MENGAAKILEFENPILEGSGLNPGEAFKHPEGEQKRGG